MEKTFFKWDDWESGDAFGFNFHAVTLLRTIGPYPIGTEFVSEDIDYSEGTLSFHDENGQEIDKFKLTLQIIE